MACENNYDFLPNPDLEITLVLPQCQGPKQNLAYSAQMSCMSLLKLFC